MPAFDKRHALAIAGLLAALAGCTAPQPRSALEAAPAALVDPRDCPRITLREDAAVSRKGAAPDYEYVVSVSEVTRSCIIENGEIIMDVGIAGRIVPGAAARSTQVSVPLRVRVTDAAGTLVHDRTGRVGVAISPGGPSAFTYVDRGVRVPAGRRLMIDAGIAQ